MMNDPVLLKGVIQTVILFSIQYVSGSLVYYKGIKVNYTRKINHFSLFFVPMFLDKFIPVKPSLELLIIGSILAVTGLIIYIKPVRIKSNLIQRMFL